MPRITSNVGLCRKTQINFPSIQPLMGGTFIRFLDGTYHPSTTGEKHCHSFLFPARRKAGFVGTLRHILIFTQTHTYAFLQEVAFAAALTVPTTWEVVPTMTTLHAKLH